MDVLDFFSGGDADEGRYATSGGGAGNSAQATNGRMRFCDDSGCSGSRATPYELYAQDAGTSRVGPEMLQSIKQVNIESSPVATMFFAQPNVEALMLALRHGVYKASGAEQIVVGPQSYTEMGIVMRATYFKESRQNSMTVSQFTADLNRRVLDYCIPTVLGEARMYLSYRRDIQRLPVPLEYGNYSTQKGSRQI